MRLCGQCEREIDTDCTDVMFICDDCKNNVIKIKIEIPAIDPEVFLIDVQNKIAAELLGKREPCPNCHMTIQDLLEVGKFGCEMCYEHYFPEFLAIAENCQDGIKHVGKFPKPKKYEPKTLEDKIKYLKLLKAKAVEMENYQEAARLAEELRQLH